MSTTATKEPDWAPRKRGDIYCSPACGRGCKREWHDAAVAAGERLRLQLTKLCAKGFWHDRFGSKWAVRVWENMGWHVECISECGRAHVYAPTGFDRTDTYHVILSERWSSHGNTPRAALASALEAANAELAELHARIRPFKGPTA